MTKQHQLLQDVRERGLLENTLAGCGVTVCLPYSGDPAQAATRTKLSGVKLPGLSMFTDSASVIQKGHNGGDSSLLPGAGGLPIQVWEVHPRLKVGSAEGIFC